MNLQRTKMVTRVSPRTSPPSPKSIRQNEYNTASIGDDHNNSIHETSIMGPYDYWMLIATEKGSGGFLLDCNQHRRQVGRFVGTLASLADRSYIFSKLLGLVMAASSVTVVRARIDSETKRVAAEALREMRLSISDHIRMSLVRLCMTRRSRSLFVPTRRTSSGSRDQDKVDHFDH